MHYNMLLAHDRNESIKDWGSMSFKAWSCAIATRTSVSKQERSMGIPTRRFLFLKGRALAE